MIKLYKTILKKLKIKIKNIVKQKEDFLKKSGKYSWEFIKIF